MPYKDVTQQKKAQHKHYLENKVKIVDRNRQRRLERKVWFEGVTKDIRCVKCGEDDRICLDFHHTNPLEKDGTVSKLLNEFRSKDRVLAEVKKCIVLCANCHRKLHYSLLVDSERIELSLAD